MIRFPVEQKATVGCGTKAGLRGEEEAHEFVWETTGQAGNCASSGC